MKKNMDYQPNSHKFKEEQKERKKIDKVVNGTVKTKKKTQASKIADIFIPEDVSSVKSYIIEDVIVPYVKDIILDTVKALLGTNGRSSKNSKADRVSYRNYYDDRNDRSYSSSRVRTSYSFDDITLETRGEAEEVISRMDELVATYGFVTVADLYDLVGVTCNYTDNKYGWTNVRNVEAIRVRDGYMLKLPKALPIS